MKTERILDGVAASAMVRAPVGVVGDAGLEPATFSV